MLNSKLLLKSCSTARVSGPARKVSQPAHACTHYAPMRAPGTHLQPPLDVLSGGVGREHGHHIGGDRCRHLKSGLGSGQG